MSALSGGTALYFSSVRLLGAHLFGELLPALSVLPGLLQAGGAIRLRLGKPLLLLLLLLLALQLFLSLCFSVALLHLGVHVDLDTVRLFALALLHAELLVRLPPALFFLLECALLYLAFALSILRNFSKELLLLSFFLEVATVLFWVRLPVGLLLGVLFLPLGLLALFHTPRVILLSVLLDGFESLPDLDELLCVS